MALCMKCGAQHVLDRRTRRGRFSPALDVWRSCQLLAGRRKDCRVDPDLLAEGTARVDAVLVVHAFADSISFGNSETHSE